MTPTWHTRSNFHRPLAGGHCVISQVSSFTGIYQVYACHWHMSSATWASTAALLRASRDFQAAFAASRLPVPLFRIFCFSAAERQATLGCGLPKFHRQVLTSYTWLPLPVCYPWRGQSPSAQPNAKSLLCRAAYSPDSVELHISCKFSPLCLFDMDIQKVGMNH